MKEQLEKDQIIHLSGTDNTRDLGGLQTSDHRIVRSKKLIRSDHLNRLTEKDCRILSEQYRVMTIVDLRRDSESARQPDQVPSGAKLVHDPLVPELKQAQTFAKINSVGKLMLESVHHMDDDVLTYDISSMQDVTSGLTIVIREYNQQGMTDEKSLPEFGEGNTIPKSLSIGFSRKQSDSIVTVTLRSDHQDSSQWNLILKAVPDAPQTLYLYEKIPYRLSSLSIDTFIPLVLYGSFWWDSDYKMCRFCGETELTEEEAKASGYFENSPHYYIIGAIFHK